MKSLSLEGHAEPSAVYATRLKERAIRSFLLLLSFKTPSRRNAGPGSVSAGMADIVSNTVSHILDSGAVLDLIERTR